ncbi:MAG: L(+)-tartrate dehydratase subunit alpha [Actinomycetaceae bacterium]|nr:L(+)-tartrate dehydratase subunit alpha [Actinomycetaceae bacterium]MDU0969938.1 L(+)-tartrate dehydratase subunit alpha [Actinomycetaceae bacterium]
MTVTSPLVASHPDIPLTVQLPNPTVRRADDEDVASRATGSGSREKHVFDGEIEKLVDALDKFTVIVSRRLPDDVRARLKELAENEKQPMAQMIYQTMERNQALAEELKRPSCQDTGLVQVFIRCGTDFPYMRDLPDAIREGVQRATWDAPLRLNTVETFDEYNTGLNTGTKSPWTYWQTIPDWDGVEMDVYLAGGGCSLPGQGKTLMPGEGYEAAMEFVLDVMTSYGLNACPPLLVGVGFGSSIDSAAYQSKLALMRPVGTHSANPLVAELEDNLKAAIDQIGLGPQGLGGSASTMGVAIENSARHPSVLSVCVNTGCWSHRRGTIRFDADLNYTLLTHKGVTL